MAGSFLGDRAFSPDPVRNEQASVAFADGLQATGVAATAKHYPGLGATGSRNTDLATAVVYDGPDARFRERGAFLAHVTAGTRAIMVSNAVYPHYDSRPAVTSEPILRQLRRDGFDGVVISDELNVPAHAGSPARTVIAATRAGVDVLLYANTDGAPAFRTLVAAVRSGRVSRATLERQVQRVIALKRWITRER